MQYDELDVAFTSREIIILDYIHATETRWEALRTFNVNRPRIDDEAIRQYD